MSSAGSMGQSQDAPFDLTPMVDVVLLLIIFFVLSTQFVQATLRPMDLPKETGDGVATPAPVNITIDLEADGKLSVLGGTPITPEEIAALIREQRDRDPERFPMLEVVVRADQNAAAAHLNRLAGVLGRQGVKRWQLATAGQ